MTNNNETTMWAHIENDVADFLGTGLPLKWRGREGKTALKNKTPEELEALNWVPLYETNVDISWDETSDGHTVEIADDNKSVSLVHRKRDMDIAEKEDRDSSHLSHIREERNKKLAESDWMALQDTDTMTVAQIKYRQALRDFPASNLNLQNPVWPV